MSKGYIAQTWQGPELGEHKERQQERAWSIGLTVDTAAPMSAAMLTHVRDVVLEIDKLAAELDKGTT